MVKRILMVESCNVGWFKSNELTPQGRVNNKCNISDSKMIIMVNIITC